MLTVTTAAENTALTTLDTVKSYLSIVTTTEDDYIGTAITSVSAAICSYLNVAVAADGTRTLGRETLVETIRFRPGSPRSWPLYFSKRNELILARRPAVSITSVVEDDVTLETTEYELDNASGILYRLTTDGIPTEWMAATVVVTYTAGWLLPDDTGRTLPQDIEDAAIVLIRADRSSRTRDPSLRSENILSGLYSYQLAPLTGTLSADATALLDPYRNINF